MDPGMRALPPIILGLATLCVILSASLSFAAAQSTSAAPQDRAAQDHEPQDHATMASGRPAPALHGVWRSRGYGYVLRIGADGLKLFHVAGPFCYADTRSKRDPDGLFVLYRPLDGSLDSGAV